MIGRDLKLVPFAFACIVEGIEFHYQNLESYWCQMSHNLIAFDIQMRWPQQGHYKEANNLGFGSTHILDHGIQNICNNGKFVNLAHGLEMPMIIEIPRRRQLCA
jgi:hypothetical protein